MYLRTIRILIIVLSGAFLSIPTAALAGDDSGLYIGIGAGGTSAKDTGFDESDSGYKALLGYNIGIVPFLDFAVEGSYVDFGKFGTVEATGVDAFGLVGFTMGPVGFFAKAGTMKWDLNTAANNSGTDPAYGVGAKFSLFSFQVRAEYEVFQFDTVDVDMLSVSAVYTF